MKKPILLLFLLTSVYFNLFGQAFEWANIQGDAPYNAV